MAWNSGAKKNLTRAEEVSGEHRDSRLEILFTLSWGNSPNQLQSVTAFMNAVEEENVMHAPWRSVSEPLISEQ